MQVEYAALEVDCEASHAAGPSAHELAAMHSSRVSSWTAAAAGQVVESWRAEVDELTERGCFADLHSV